MPQRIDEYAAITGVPVEQITFVIRAAGERTAEAAERILRMQLGPRNKKLVQVITERPFVRAVRRTLEIGVEAGRPFTVGMDADVLLVAGGAQRIAQLAGALSPGMYSAVGLMLCRFFGGYCFRGVHVYRTDLLERAIPLVGMHTPGGPDPALKPESAAVHAMAAHGHGFASLPVVLAIHDYEQSYRHIYLKMRMRGRREATPDGAGPALESFLDCCRDQAARGVSDFTVALWGLEDGAADARQAAVNGTLATISEYDWYAPLPEFERRMREQGLVEKPALDTSGVLHLPDQTIIEHQLDTDHRTPAWIRDHLSARRAA